MGKNHSKTLLVDAFVFRKRTDKICMRSSGYVYTVPENTNLVSLGDVTIHSMVQACSIRAGQGAWREPPTPLGTRKERDDDQLEQK